MILCTESYNLVLKGGQNSTKTVTLLGLWFIIHFSNLNTIYPLVSYIYWKQSLCIKITYRKSMSNVLYILKTNFPNLPGSKVEGIAQYLPCVNGTLANTLLPFENGPECSFVSRSCIRNFLFMSV